MLIIFGLKPRLCLILIIFLNELILFINVEKTSLRFQSHKDKKSKEGIILYEFFIY